MMKAAKYIVIGRYDSERNSWIENGDIRHVVSEHRTQLAAARAADRAHSDLGGCDGSHALAEVARRLEPGEAVAEEADTFAHAGRTYLVLSYWDTRSFVAVPGGLALIPKS